MTSLAPLRNTNNVSSKVFESEIEDALKDNSLLLSWKSVFFRLTSPPRSAVAVKNLRNWLLSDRQIAALSSCYAPFPSPNESSKRLFETKTAAINITSESLIPIATLKEDAKSLSERLQIDEIEALRVCILDCQEHLYSIDSEVDGGSELPSGFGSLEFQFKDSLWTSNTPQAEAQNPSDEKISKLQRYIRRYFSERRYLIKTATALVRAALSRNFADGTKNYFHTTGKKFIRKLVLANTAPGGPHQSFVESLITSVELRATRKETFKFMSELLYTDDGERILYEWEKHTLLEQFHLLQLLFLLIYKPVKATASVVTAWFTTMKSTSFLSDQRFISKAQTSSFQPVVKSIIGLTSILSVAMISLDRIMLQFSNQRFLNELKAPGQDPFYLESPSAVQILNSVLLEFAAERSDPVASLAAWSWAVTLRNLRSIVDEVKNCISFDGLESSDPSDSLKLKQQFDKTLASYDTVILQLDKRRDETGSDDAIALANGALRSDFFFVLSQLFLGVGGESGWSLTREEDAERMQRVLTLMLRNGLEYIQFNEKVVQSVVVAYGTLNLETGSVVQGSSLNGSELDDSDCDDERSPNASPGTIVAKGLGSERNTSSEEDDDIIRDFWNDEMALYRTIHPARSRFPYEFLSFLSLIRSVTPTKSSSSAENPSHQFLAGMNTFTQVLPAHFRGFEVDVVDPENIILTQPLTALNPRMEDGEGAMILPEGLLGKVVSSGVSPPIVRWGFKYSAIQFMGRMLENALLEEAAADKAALIEILSIFERILASYKDTTALDSDVEMESGVASAATVLEQASDLMAPNRDIVSVLFDLNETALSSCLEEKSTDFAVASLRLITTLLPIIPGRVWPYIGRSTLLERQGRGGSVSRILESVEVVTGKYDLLLECVNLYESIVTDAIKGVVVGGTIGSAVSVVGREGVGSGVSRAVQMDILENWTRFWGGIVGGFRGWKYVDIGQRTSLNLRIFSAFNSILSTVYGLDTNPKSTQGTVLFAVLKPSAEYLVHLFLTDEEAVLPLEPIISALSDGCATPETTLYISAQAAWVSSVIATLAFTTIAVRVRALLNLPPSQLETLLYARTPSLVAMYEIDFRYRLPVIELLESMVNNSHTWVNEPPSLLGHLGQGGATKFVAQLAQLDGKIRDEELECAIWRFVSAVLGNKQQGLSIMLVAGADQSKKPRSKSMLAIALDALSDISHLPSSITLAMLETVSLAQNSWGSVTTEIRNHKHFLDAIISFVDGLNVEFLPADENPVITEKCNRLATAAYIAQLLAMHLHQDKGRNISVAGGKKDDFLDRLLPKLHFYAERGVTISSYKPSLHGFLTTNFEKKWPSCKLECLKKSTIQRREYGPQYFYDVTIAGTVLGWDKGWDKSKPERSNGSWSRAVPTRWGFKYDVERANLNIALVDSQVSLLRAWSLLSTELASHIHSHGQSIPSVLGKVIKASLKANVSENLPPLISTIVTTDRAGLAFNLLSKLNDHSPPLPPSTYEGMLELVWQVISFSEEDFRRSLRNGGDDYYRSLLRSLYILLNVELAKSEVPSASSLQRLAEIFELVIAKGFSDLASAAYDFRESSEPADMLLIIGILQTMLSFPSIEPIYGSLVGHLEDNGTLRAASTLFTWAPKLTIAPQLAGEEGDPVYGELSIIFLVKLSALPVIAEQLVLGNIFISLTEGELSTKIQAGNLSPTTTPRLHNIWAKGFLPLILNLLFVLGKRIATEVSAFLRSFVRQFSTAVQMLVKPSTVSIPQISEMTDIIAIVSVLESMGVSILDDFAAKRRMIASACEQWSTHKAWLSSLVVPTNATEDLLWESGKEGNKLFEKILEDSKTLSLLVAEEEDEDDDMSK